MEQEKIDIKQLTNDDILDLYSTIEEHINYLNQKIIVPEIETSEEKSEDDTNE